MLVIPANAGVILEKDNIKIEYEGYPRECGGDPDIYRLVDEYIELSPRMRG